MWHMHERFMKLSFYFVQLAAISEVYRKASIETDQKIVEIDTSNIIYRLEFIFRLFMFDKKY